MQNPQVIYKNKQFLVLSKPAGLLVHAAKGKKEESLVDWLVKNYPEVKSVGDDPEERSGIVHRLDRETSGALLVCLTQKAFEYFKKQFQEHQIQKTYLALVHGVPKEREGIINKPIGLKMGTIKRTVHIRPAGRRTKMVKEAITKYKLKKVFGDKFSLLEIQPLTGRTHQIRVHLASIGHPIVGDKLYGPKKQSAPRMFLHAQSLEFTAPDGQRLKIDITAPKLFTEELN